MAPRTLLDPHAFLLRGWSVQAGRSPLVFAQVPAGGNLYGKDRPPAKPPSSLIARSAPSAEEKPAADKAGSGRAARGAGGGGGGAGEASLALAGKVSAPTSKQSSFSLQA